MASTTPSPAQGLNVIALVSGGKDSFFSLLHCQANGHRIVALANLHPALPSPGSSSFPATPATASAVVSGSRLVAGDAAIKSSPQCKGQGQSQPKQKLSPAGVPEVAHLHDEEEQDERDLNSFMYQTVGHQVIPFYEEATGLPLYRRAITGGAGVHGKDYSPVPQGDPVAGSGASSGSEAQSAGDADETESMIPLLRAAMAAHPEANAISAGAILSTYQRTRVESVATRLGLVPLAYLWKFPALPSRLPPLFLTTGDAQLLDDMAAVGLEARIIKVASGGLDDSFLWTNVASADGKHRVATAMRRYGAQETGAIIGEGGEFETLVLDGPPALFRKRIMIAEEDRCVVREGGGTAWLKLSNARLETKDDGDAENGNDDAVRTPTLFDDSFSLVLETLHTSEPACDGNLEASLASLDLGGHTEENSRPLGRFQDADQEKLQQWCFIGDKAARSSSIEAETRSVVKQVRHRLELAMLPPSAIVSATILLRRMADFPEVNAIYGTLFNAPNPPSRVTVSCGDLLSKDPSVSIVANLSVHCNLRSGQRQGLHVQSRSYWAPANIGPYSQAITIPVASLVASGGDITTDESTRLVSIAGQIPLIPATMTLPTAREGTLSPQLILSLQHLWRIGLATGVQWWSSTVAYFPRARPDEEPMSTKALLASKAWEAVHLQTAPRDGEDGEDEEDESGPDLWDRRFNPQYMMFGVGDEANTPPKLPDWCVLLNGASAPQQAGVLKIPPLFAAEVWELPRSASIEWHAHVGFSGLEGGRVEVHHREFKAGENKKTIVDVHHTVVRPGSGKGVTVVYTTVAKRLPARHGGRKGDDPKGRLEDTASIAMAELVSLGGTLAGTDAAAGAPKPMEVVRYVDVERAEDDTGLGVGIDGSPLVPCASLWDSRGRGLASVVVYQSVFEG